MRHAVLGAAGQLGRELSALLGCAAVALTREQIDLTRPDTLRAVLGEVRPDVVLNCAAYNFVDRAETEPAAAFAVNAWGVRELALWCRQQRCTLVHFSTDHVFGLDEAGRTPWTEADAPGPVSVYGLSKLAGEYLVRSLCPRSFVVRTCGLYGRHGSGGKGGNFVETMLRLAGQGRPVRVVADQTCTPSAAAEVARATLALLATGRHGLYHVTNAGECSWYDFARAVFDLAELAVDLVPLTSAEYGAAARRPAYSVLSGQAMQTLGLPPLRPWRDALADYLAERAA